MQVFYSESRGTAVDGINGAGTGLYSKQSKDELEAAYGPLIEICAMDAGARMEAAARTPWREIPSDQYLEAFEASPPIAVHRGAGAMSFRMSEATTMNVHPTFLEIDGRYFCKQERLSVTHAELVGQVRSIIDAYLLTTDKAGALQRLSPVPMRSKPSETPVDWLRFQGQHIRTVEFDTVASNAIQRFLHEYNTDAMRSSHGYVTLAGNHLAKCDPFAI
jgi:hypothetical protein